jgi:hypothetical protein
LQFDPFCAGTQIFLPAVINSRTVEQEEGAEAHRDFPESLP